VTRDRGTGTRAATAATGAGVVLLALSASTHDGWLVLLAGCAFGLPVAALLLRPRLGDIHVEVGAPSRSTVGAPVVARLTISNTGRRTSPTLTVALTATGLDGALVRVPPLAPAGRACTDVELHARRRGVVTQLTAVVGSAAPLGIITVHRSHVLPADLLVRPALGTPMHALRGGSGDGAATAAPNGIEVQGVREWRPGESTGRIHARGTARHGRPLVLDRFDGVGDGVAFVVAGAGVAEARSDPLVESMISVVAATLDAAARTGRPVAAVTNQRGLANIVEADPDALLDWCARLVAPGPPRAEDIRAAADVVGRGGVVVLAGPAWSPSAPWWGTAVATATACGVELHVLPDPSAR